MAKIEVERFCLQTTENFPDGAPQREEFISDEHFNLAVAQYEVEWLDKYECAGCGQKECPQCGTQLPLSCANCAHWRQQSGSAHVLCPIDPDFRLCEQTPCGLYQKAPEKIDRTCNAFMIWSGSRPETWPSKEKIEAERAKR